MINNSRGSTFVVKRQIRDKDGSPAASLMVKAFDKNLDGEELLSETTTDEGGAYQITYMVEQFSHDDNDRADLIVRVFDKEASGEFGPNKF
jgi:5-hydroxyisourate hydrolase-like protein (transthyretin family)